MAATPAWTTPHQADVSTAATRVVGDLDVDGDGFDDLVLGGAGGLRWFRGGPGGYAAEPAWSVTGPDDGGFAASVTGADVDGDGFGDVVAGTRQGPRAWYGSPAGLAPAPSWGWSGDGARDPGRGVAGLGDVNGDGFDDLAVAPDRQDPTRWVDGEWGWGAP